MAAPMRMFLTRTWACVSVENSVVNPVFCASRLAVCVDQKRWKSSQKRNVPPDVHWVKRKGHPARQRAELTSENKQFLQDLVIDEYSQMLEDSPLKHGPWVRNPYTVGTRRTGLIGIKLGSYPMWSKTGKKFDTTLVQVLDNHVVKYIPPETFKTYPSYKTRWKKRNFSYGSLVVGALSCEPFKFSKAYVDLFRDAGIPPKRKLMRFAITEDAKVQPGTPLTVSHFRVGDYVDIQARTVGHGFQGVVKRWGFKGGPASHGPTKFQRRPGATGGGGDKGRIWRGKKMPGHMGDRWRMHRGLRIWRINYEYNILYLHGSHTPGPTHCYTRIFDSTLAKHMDMRMGDPPPMPAWIPEDREGPIPEEEFHDELFRFEEPSITFGNAELEKAKAK